MRNCGVGEASKQLPIAYWRIVTDDTSEILRS